MKIRFPVPCSFLRRFPLLVLFSAATGFAQFTWNPITDFSINNGNPNGVWTYGRMDTGFATFTAFTNSLYASNLGNSPFWGGTPEVWSNTSGQTYQGIVPGSLSLHPGSGGEPAVLRWTAPAGFTGTVDVNGQFLPGDAGSMQVAVRRGGTVLWSATDSGSFALHALGVTAGDTLDFAVFGGYSSGSTGLVFTITGTAAVPEPAAGAALLAGAVLACASWRRRQT